MKIGLMADERSFRSIADFCQWVSRADGAFHALWLGQHQSWDPLTLLALAGQLRPDLSYGSAVTLSYPQHPIALAGQAMTAAAATGGHLTLGLGVGHQALIERVYGYSAQRPARHLREYLDVLGPLLNGDAVDYHGELIRASGSVAVPSQDRPRMLVAALGPVMLGLAGSSADGTILSWTTPRAVQEHVLPIVSKAAASAGRPDPAVVATVAVCVADDETPARSWAQERFAAAATLPNYRTILERGGATDIDDAMAVGSAATVERYFCQLRDAGVTEFIAMPVGTTEQIAGSTAVLAGLAT